MDLRFLTCRFTTHINTAILHISMATTTMTGIYYCTFATAQYASTVLRGITAVSRRPHHKKLTASNSLALVVDHVTDALPLLLNSCYLLLNDPDTGGWDKQIGGKR